MAVAFEALADRMGLKKGRVPEQLTSQWRGPRHA